MFIMPEPQKRTPITESLITNSILRTLHCTLYHIIPYHKSSTNSHYTLINLGVPQTNPNFSKCGLQHPPLPSSSPIPFFAPFLAGGPSAPPSLGPPPTHPTASEAGPSSTPRPNPTTTKVPSSSPIPQLTPRVAVATFHVM